VKSSYYLTFPPQYDWKLSKSTAEENEVNEPSQQVLFELVKKQLPPRLTKFFETFPKAIIDTHSRDILSTPTASGQATPLNNSSTSPVVTPAAVVAATAAAASSSSKAAKPAKKVINTSTVRVEAQFMVSASDLFAYLTDEARIPQWTRAPAQVRQLCFTGRWATYLLRSSLSLSLRVASLSLAAASLANISR
jgi:activator of HSP90 ATPase